MRPTLCPTGFNRTRLLNGATKQQKLFRQRRLSRIGVRNNRERTPTGDVVFKIRHGKFDYLKKFRVRGVTVLIIPSDATKIFGEFCPKTFHNNIMKDVQLNLTERDLFSVLLDRHKKQNIPETNPPVLAKIMQISLKLVSILKSARHTRDVTAD